MAASVKVVDRTNSSKVNSSESDELSLQLIYVVGVNPSDPIQVQVKVDNCSLSMEMDTGVAASIMSRSQQNSLLPGLLLNSSKVQLKKCTGASMEVLGEVTVQVSYTKTKKRNCL